MKWSFLASIIYLPLLFVTMVLDRPVLDGIIARELTTGRCGGAPE